MIIMSSSDRRKRDRNEIEQPLDHAHHDATSDRLQKVPVSLGKPSLRLRLEAYYKLIAPDQISDQAEWRTRFDQIWNKFGGSHEGERKLAVKLAKKYGTAVTLRLAAEEQEGDVGKAHSHTVSKSQSAELPTTQQYTEEWFQLTESERGSGVVDFTSDCFDPLASLAVDGSLVEASNPFILSCPRLDRVQQFRRFLPLTDPLHHNVAPTTRLSSHPDTTTTAPKVKSPSCFAAIASHHENTTLSMLYHAFQHRLRIRILIRYVNGIRGTLTGRLLAFDQHMNLLLQNAEEVYSPRYMEDEEDSVHRQLSNTEIELQRRRRQQQLPHRLPQQQETGGTLDTTHWTVRRRHLRQVMVRGDNVVLIYRPDQEQSAFDGTLKSRYRPISVKRNVPYDERIGTPGFQRSIPRGRS